MPNESYFEVTYYLSDEKLTLGQRKSKTQLYIQHHDCICILEIDKDLSRNSEALETLVHNKVIATKGHLC